MTELFSSWTFIRTSGFLGFYFLTLSLSLGLVQSLSILKKKKAMFLSLHQKSSWYGLLTIIFHIILIWQDQFVPYSLGELFIPFYGENEPLFSSLGTLSFYLFFLVGLSSDFFMKKLGFKKWKNIHFAVFPAWILMLIHGLAIGTDSSEPWAYIIYSFSSFLIIVLLFIRIIDYATKHQSSRRHHLKS